MESIYRTALQHIACHPGTGSSLGLAKLVLSLYNRGNPFAFAECTFSFDETRLKMAGDMITEYLRTGESEELLAAGRAVGDLYPELLRDAALMRDARLRGVAQTISRDFGFGGMTTSQLDRLDEYALRLIDDPKDGSYGVLSTGERNYVLLAASRADLLAEYDDTIPEALSRLGDADVKALAQRWQYRHYRAHVPGQG